ncbi:MAG: hypothetical protein ACYDG4_08755 [Desulfuromonadaceae bacterium]
MSKYSTSYNPKHRVRFIDLFNGKLLYDVSDDLISLSTNKAYGRAAGTWQITLVCRRVDTYEDPGLQRADPSLNLPVIDTRRRYDESIKPNDMITIELDAGDGSGMKTVMLGLVDRVSFVFPGGKNPQRHVKISGQDMGKLLATHDISWDIRRYNLSLALSGNKKKGKDKKKSSQINRQFDPSLTMGTPAEILSGLFAKTFRETLPWHSHFFGLTFERFDDWKIRAPGLIQSSHGTKLWDVMKQFEHRPFNVLTTETVSVGITGNIFYVTLEKQPFKDNGQIDRTGDRLHSIDGTVIISSEIGTSDAERCNFLFYRPDLYITAVGGQVDVAMGHPDLVRYDDAEIQLNGYCPLIFDDAYTPAPFGGMYDSAPKGDFFATAREAADLLWGWYKDNHTYKSGSIQIHLSPWIKAGDGLIQELDIKNKIEYLIEQVSHQYVLWPQMQFVTTLHVTRGQKYYG